VKLQVSIPRVTRRKKFPYATKTKKKRDKRRRVGCVERNENKESKSNKTEAFREVWGRKD